MKKKLSRRALLMDMAAISGGSLLASEYSVLPVEAATLRKGVTGSGSTEKTGAPSQTPVRIGNYFIDAPYGIAIIVDDQTAFLIEPVGDDRLRKSKYSPEDVAYLPPGTTSPDFSFSECELHIDNAKVRFRWGRSGRSAAVATFETDKAVVLTLRLRKTWPQFHTSYGASRDGIVGYGIEPRGVYIPFRLRCDPAPVHVRADLSQEAEVTLALDPKRPARLVAGVGKLPGMESVEPALKETGERYARMRMSSEGDWGDFLGAIGDNVNNSRFYGSDNHRVAHSIGRGWWISHQRWFEGNADLFPYFVWDLFFLSLLASLEDPEGAHNTVRAVLSFQTPEGAVPSYSHWGADNNYVSMDRSMPPVGALCVWKMHQRRPSKAFLSEVYPHLVRWHNWWMEKRDGNHDGLLEWGSEERYWQDAQYETGWDDNVEYERAQMAGTTMNANAVDLNSMWAMDAEYLGLIAEALGKKEESKHFYDQHAQMNRRINDRLWNEDLGIYCSRLWSIPPKVEPELTPQKIFKDGFAASFFPDWRLAQAVTQRNDAQIDFDWEESSPAEGIRHGKWAARWTGTFEPPATGEYRLVLTAEGFARVWLGGNLVIDRLTPVQAGRKQFSDVKLTAGGRYPVVIEYFKDSGKASLRLAVHRLLPGQPGSDWLTRLTPMNFYPLICGAASPQRARRVLAWLYRPDKFWLPWLLPTVAKDDPVWPQQEYWKGHVWPPSNYLVWLGIQRYADGPHQVEYARRSVELFMRNWREKRQCCENYKSTDGTCGDHPHYTWGALLCLIGLEAMADVGPDFRPRPRKYGTPIGNMEMRNVPFGGRLYRLSARGKEATASLEDRS